MLWWIILNHFWFRLLLAPRIIPIKGCKAVSGVILPFHNVTGQLGVYKAHLHIPYLSFITPFLRLGNWYSKCLSYQDFTVSICQRLKFVIFPVYHSQCVIHVLLEKDWKRLTHTVVKSLPVSSQTTYDKEQLFFLFCFVLSKNYFIYLKIQSYIERQRQKEIFCSLVSPTPQTWLQG